MAEKEDKKGGAKPEGAKQAKPAGGGGGAPPAKDKGGGKGAPAGAKGKDDKKGKDAGEAAKPIKRTAPPRLKTLYDQEVSGRLLKEFTYKNKMQVPRLVKITLNMGLGEAIGNPKIMDFAVDELRNITGQQPVITKAKNSIATFKLREGQKIGCMVTLRRERMWEFFDRLVNLALPRVPSMAAATSRWASASRSSSPRSTTTRSTRSRASTSPS